MRDTVQHRFKQTIAALVAALVVLSVLGPVGTVAAQEVSVTQSEGSVTAAPGETVTLTTTVTTTDLNGPGLEVQLPTGWTGSIMDSDGGFPNVEAGGNVLQVVFLQSGTYQVSYEVQVPSDASPGDYQVDVEGSGINPDNGARITNSAQTTITVEEEQPNSPPTASIGGPSSAQVGEEVTFDASGSSDADGSIDSYEWDLGDGTTDTGGSVAHTFGSPGEYTVELTVTDDEGATDTAMQTVSVSAAPTPANFQVSNLNVPSSATQGEVVTVSATVENTGDEEGTQTVSLNVEDNFVDDEDVTLAGGESQEVSFQLDTSGFLPTSLAVEIATEDGSESALMDLEAPASSPGPQTGVSISPGDKAITTGQSTTYDVVVDNADGGVGTYEFNVSLDDPSVAMITDVVLASSATGQLTDIQIAEDGSSVSVTAALDDTADSGSVPIATVTLLGNQDGATDLSIAVDQLGTEAGDAYDVTGTSGASLTVATLLVTEGNGPAQDLDGDGTYEDVDGDGEVTILDVQALFVNRDSNVVQNNQAAFDFTGDGGFNILDIQKLFYTHFGN